VLVLEDESDEDMLEQDETSASPKSDGEGKKLSRVKAAAEMSMKNDSHVVGLAKTGPVGSGKKVMGKQPLLLAGIGPYTASQLFMLFWVNLEKETTEEIPVF